MIIETDKKTIRVDRWCEHHALVYTKRIEGYEPHLSYMIIKRGFDIFGSLAALAVLLVPMIIISIIICLDSSGSPIFKQTRLGKNEKPFTILKFRSMKIDAEKNGAQWAEDDDPRVTKVGGFLRRTRLDELPQLVNILLGQMSFVGPRPERPEFYDIFDTYIIGFRQRMMVTPGLTGYAQINGGYDLLPEEKIAYDIEYIKKQSVWMDTKCLVQTMGILFSHKGAR